MEANRAFEASVYFYQTTERYGPQGRNLRPLSGESQISPRLHPSCADTVQSRTSSFVGTRINKFCNSVAGHCAVGALVLMYRTEIVLDKQ